MLDSCSEGNWIFIESLNEWTNLILYSLLDFLCIVGYFQLVFHGSNCSLSAGGINIASISQDYFCKVYYFY